MNIHRPTHVLTHTHTRTHIRAHTRITRNLHVAYGSLLIDRCIVYKWSSYVNSFVCFFIFLSILCLLFFFFVLLVSSFSFVSLDSYTVCFDSFWCALCVSLVAYIFGVTTLPVQPNVCVYMYNVHNAHFNRSLPFNRTVRFVLTLAACPLSLSLVAVVVVNVVDIFTYERVCTVCISNENNNNTKSSSQSKRKWTSRNQNAQRKWSILCALLYSYFLSSHRFYFFFACMLSVVLVSFIRHNGFSLSLSFNSLYLVIWCTVARVYFMLFYSDFVWFLVFSDSICVHDAILTLHTQE